MIMRELGLLSFWKRQYTIRADLQVSRCMSIIHSKETELEKQLDRKPLTLGSLYGAFILLFFGYILAKLVFAFELITFHRGSLKRKIARVNREIMKQTLKGLRLLIHLLTILPFKWFLVMRKSISKKSQKISRK